jgi:modification methylase
MLPLDQILSGDNLEVLATLPERSVDLIFADPPYNLQLQGELWRPNNTMVDAVDDEWDRFDDFEAYDMYTEQWLSACRRVLKDDGTIWVIGSYHNIFRVGKIMMDLGYWILNDLTWIKCLSGSTELYCLVNDRPLISSIKDLARIDPTKHKIQLPSYDEQGCFTWVDVAAMQRTEGKSRGLRIACEDGSWVECTANHVFPVVRSGQIEYISAAQLTTTDILIKLRKFHAPTVIESEGMDEAIGEYIGWYLAEGNLLDNEDGVQFSMCSDEIPVAERLIELIKRRFGVVGRIHIYSKSMHLIFSSRFIVALIKRFVQGNDAKTKRLTREAFYYGLPFVKGILSGYLQGDGHWESKSSRWRIGLCRNEGLITDLGVICKILEHRLRFAYAYVPYKRGQAEIIRGSIKENKDLRWSYAALEDLGLPARGMVGGGQGHSIYQIRSKYRLITRKSRTGSMTPVANHILYGDIEPLKISAIYPGTLRQFYDLGLKQNHIFALANGLLTHNSNPMPNFRGVRFTNAHETLIWAKKSKEQKRYTFNYGAMRNLNDEKQMRSDWEIPLCTGSERIRVDGEKAHTTQKPEALLYRVIMASSNPGDVVLDPFFGTGTTGAVAKKLHRHWIGIERDSAYVKVAQERIDAIVPPMFDEELYSTPTKRDAPRIPFGRLLEAGLLRPGDTLYLDKNGQTARVAADGTLHSEDQSGSIHSLGAKLLGLPALNGWEHWYYWDEDKGEKVLIDKLRERLRGET